MDDRLRPLWDFDDLDASEARFHAELAQAVSDEVRAEVLTQLARIEGLRGDFDAGEQLIEQAESRAGGSAIALARIDLEHGRLRRSSGNVEAELPLFESAFAVSLEAGGYFIAVDAAHMAALVAPDRDGCVAWTQRGIDLAEEHEGAAYWLGPLLNNLGWELYEARELPGALDAFERALRAREQDPANASAIEIARYAVGKTLRVLDRPGEAVPLLEQAVAWAEREGAPDGWFHEELAEDYAALGRDDDARKHARLALELLEAADPSRDDGVDHLTHLRRLADG